MVILYLILPAFFIAITFSDSSISISQAYPGAFSEDPNILVTNVSIHGINGFSINEFSDPTRNHYDSRNGAKIKYLIMHYTEINFTKTVETFTTNSTVNRVSAHYVITEKAVNNFTGGHVRYHTFLSLKKVKN